MGKIKFLFPIDGDCIDLYDGERLDSGIIIKVRLSAPRDSDIYVNGMKASEENGEYTANVRIGSYRTAIVALDKRNGSEEKITVFYFPESFGKYRLSSDDNILFLQDITRNKDNYSSIFDNPYLALYKKAHDLYGAKVHLNLFYEFKPEEAHFGDQSREYFNLSMMTDRFKEEFRENSSWLKLAFHARSEMPDEPYKHADGETVYRDAAEIYKEIIRFAGRECISDTTTVHWGEATHDGVRALRSLGMHSLTGYFEKHSNGRPLVAYYTEGELTDHIGSRDFFYDTAEDILFGRIDLVLNLKTYDWVMDTLKEVAEDKHRSGFVEIMIHEQYFYKDYKYHRPDFSERVLDSCRFLAEKGYIGAHISEVTREYPLNQNPIFD